MLDGHREYAANHAAALDNFARLYLDMGYPHIAVRMEGSVLRAYGGLGDHANVARSCVTLASLEINEAHRRKGKKLVQKPLPAVLNLSKRGLQQPDLVKVIAALHKKDE